MIGKNIFRKTLAACLTVAVWSVSSMFALAAPGQDMSGELRASGNVTVNNRAAVSDSTVASGSTLMTGDNSTAIVNLGKLGSVELMANSNLVLKFDNSGIYGTLETGKMRVMTNAGVNANIATREGMAIADAAQASTFTVDKECGHTHLDTVAGMVTMRANGEDKQIAAGSSNLAGNLNQTGCKPCLRPNPNGNASVETLGLSSGALLGVLVAAGAAVGTAIFFGTRGGSSTTTNTGGIVVVSPIR